MIVVALDNIQEQPDLVVVVEQSYYTWFVVELEMLDDRID
jgi:hypothetical protein